MVVEVLSLSLCIRCPWPMGRALCDQPTEEGRLIHRTGGRLALHFRCTYGHRFHTTPQLEGCEPCDCHPGG